MMTKVQIIEQVMEGYIKDPSTRAIEGKKCKYKTEDGRKCAIGRCMKEDNDRKIFNLEEDVEGLEDYLNKDGKKLDDILEDKYKGHDINFWMKLQEMHDTYILWNEEGLTAGGKTRYQQLLNEYKNK